MIKTYLALGLIACMGAMHPSSAFAGEAYQTEIRIYQVLTNISGDTSQTLPCTTSDIVHEIAQSLDGVELRMKGEELTWNGAPEPNHPLIVPTGSMHLIMRKDNPIGSLAAQSEAQYFSSPDGDRWVLSTAEHSPGMEFTMQLHPDANAEGVISNEYRFEFAYIKERKTLPGVLLDVGEPVIASIVSQGTWRIRLGEWSCLFAQVPSKGRLYLFSKTTVVDADTSSNQGR